MLQHTPTPAISAEWKLLVNSLVVPQHPWYNLKGPQKTKKQTPNTPKAAAEVDIQMEYSSV